MIDRITQKQETAQSVISYSAGGGLVGFASLSDIASYAHQWAIILGCMVVAVRLAHDAIKLVRYVRKPKSYEQK